LQGHKIGEGGLLLDYTLQGGIIVSPGKKVHTGDLNIFGEYIVSERGSVSVDLQKKSYVYPSLINTHDHLQGNYLPRVGPKEGAYYLTWLPWDKDLKASETFRERSALSREELYALSGYKFLFSGVTTVNDHFPQKLNRDILPTLPVRAMLDYGIAHECSSYDLKWGDGMEVEHQRAVENKWPFITHLSEGFDIEAMHAIEALENLKILDSHCLLVHCIGFSDEDIKKAAKAGVSVSWCGCSNMFMFNVTAKIRKMIKAGINITIGTDSSATGSVNLLDEIKYDRNLYRAMYGEDLPAKKIFEMVTHNAAKALWLDDRIGTLDLGMLGDILVLRARYDDPYENFVNTSMENIELLVLAGKPIYGETRFLELFGEALPPDYSRIEVFGRSMFVKGDPAGLYQKMRRKVGFKKMLDYMPFDPSAEEFVDVGYTI
jgi:cytosine/adenosine deaminase-related metal-dependent hydrolase